MPCNTGKAGEFGRARSDASGHVPTTNHGVAIGDKQNPLKAGLRGSTLAVQARQQITLATCWPPADNLQSNAGQIS